MMILREAVRTWQPRTKTRAIHWAIENAFTHLGTPYSHFAYPHIGAPGGVFDAYDCDQYHTLWLQWASRLGKTFSGEVLTEKQADCDPCPMMFAASTETLAKEIVSRTYGMIEACPRLCKQLPPLNRRRQNCINLGVCRVYVAWARSASTLADKDIRFGHAAEIDKWEHASTSTEADPLKLYDDRFKNSPTFKRLKESTPAVRGTSRIEKGRRATCDAKLYAPCLKCWRYQKLRIGDGKQPGGIVWDHAENGRSDKDLASRTARYICEHCESELYDDARGEMMRSAVWVPEGCEVDDEKAAEAAATWLDDEEPWSGWSHSPWIIGTPLQDGSEWGSQLSSLYALSLKWGQIAEEFVKCAHNPQDLRNFVNGWKAETWEIIARREAWEAVGKRLICGDQRRGIVPLWASLVTIGVDYQKDGNRYPFVVDAWGPDRRNATIAYGECDSLDQLEADVLKAAWPHADEGQPLRAKSALIDSGFRPVGIYEFCDRITRGGFPCYPGKGSPRALASDYDRVRLGKNTARPGTELYHVDTVRSQTWLDHTIGNRIFLGKTDAVIAKGTSGNVSRYTGAEVDTLATDSVKFLCGAAPSGKWCFYTEIDGVKHAIALECGA